MAASSRQLLARAIPLLAGSLAFAFTCAAGCSSEEEGDGGSTSTETRPPATPESARAAYTEVDARLMQNCNACHAGSVEDNFLEPGDEEGRYQRLKQWPAFITPDPRDSVLLTYPKENGTHPGQSNQVHPGSALEAVDGLRVAMQNWLLEEARLIVDDPAAGPLGIGTDPITPILGLNVLYLDGLHPELDGVAITFIAEEASFGLALTDLDVYTTDLTGVTMDRPRLVIYPLGVEAKTATLTDAFNSLKLDVPASSVQQMGEGQIFLTDWVPEAKIAFHFKELKPYTAAAPAGNPCLDFPTFDTRAKPQLGACVGCHADQNNEAHLAMNLTGLNDPAAVADTCAQILARRVLPDDPGNSLIFLNTDPSGPATHQFKFGDPGVFNTFKSEITVWIEAERAAAMAAGQ
ncbi:hypothetical protein [Chondromyces apiculatus]|uniref:Cytochrome c domain-containing protein n=1 Tax=Chondromyces apiculatus DSM 436 TaxID=1192034 RepID=A0A017TI58_9BACT|nr:hypothetical protein [Chondromyces apiculatus]EYF08520.1 Hypothetical protein CAP_4050 [Chondromyces apiculatus DSM 436]